MQHSAAQGSDLISRFLTGAALLLGMTLLLVVSRSAVADSPPVSGTVYYAGYNEYGWSGTGLAGNLATPSRVQDLSLAVEIENGFHHNLALLSDGTIRAWGLGSEGQLGHGSFTHSTTPVMVSGVSTATQIAGGELHSVALLADGTVRCWGFGRSGQLGNGSLANSSTPVTVTGLPEAVQIAAGALHTLALCSDGTVWAWGRNRWGELGNRGLTDSSLPVRVSGLTDVVEISATGTHNLARKADGTVWAWGYNAYGQLGNNSTANSTVPVQVQNLPAVAGIGSGYYHSLAILADGTVRAWGHNGYGNLGDGSTVHRLLPVPVPGLTDVVQVGGGLYHSSARRADGSVWTWGANHYGELGKGTFNTPLLTPQPGLFPRAVDISSHGHQTLALAGEPNRAPHADAGLDQAVGLNGALTAVTLDGSGSTDPDGDPLTYTWSSTDGPLAIGSSPTVQLPRGLHLLTLTVTDPYGADDADTVWVQVGVADVTAQVRASLLRQSYNAALRTAVLYLRIENTGTATLANPLSLVLDGLPADITVLNPSGATTAASGGAAGSPYVNGNVSGGLAPGRSLTLAVQFRTSAALSDTPGSLRVLSGPGTR